MLSLRRLSSKVTYSSICFEGGRMQRVHGRCMHACGMEHSPSVPAASSASRHAVASVCFM